MSTGGHVSRSSGLAKTILQGTVKGVRRQKKRWEDSIGKWTGLEFAKSKWAVNREKMEELVVKSSEVS